MKDRISQELELIRQQYPGVSYQERWVLLPEYRLVDGWQPMVIPIVFFIREGYPGIGPYGIYVPVGIRFKGESPKNYNEPAEPQPPFPGKWGMFSWEAEDWQPSANIETGHNLLNWVQGFKNRFREGL